MPRGFEGKGSEELRNKLTEISLPQFAQKVLSELRQPDFISKLSKRESGSGDFRAMIWCPTGPLWTSLRKEALKVFSEAGLNRAVQGNAYGLLHWFVLIKGGHTMQPYPNFDQIFSNQENFDAVWKAAIAVPIAERAVYNIRDLPEIAKLLGIKFEPPTWWQDTLVRAGIIPAPAALAASATPAASGTNGMKI